MEWFDYCAYYCTVQSQGRKGTTVRQKKILQFSHIMPCIVHTNSSKKRLITAGGPEADGLSSLICLYGSMVYRTS